MVGYVVTQEFAQFVRKHYDEEILAGRQSVTHDWKHAYNVAWNAEQIVHGEEGDQRERTVAFVAGLMHDWCRKKESFLKDNGIKDNHEIEGAKIAREILPKWKYDEKFVEDVAKAIETHSFGISIHGDRNIAEPESLASMAIKAADKLEQCQEAVVWRRAVFLGESTNGKATDEEMLAYCRKREKKMAEFLETPVGKLLVKHYYKAPQGLQFVKEFNDELEHEIKLVTEKPQYEEVLSKVGALGIMRGGLKYGAEGKPTIVFKKAFDAAFPAIKVPPELEGISKFTVRMMMVML